MDIWSYTLHPYRYHCYTNKPLGQTGHTQSWPDETCWRGTTALLCLSSYTKAPSSKQSINRLMEVKTSIKFKTRKHIIYIVGGEDKMFHYIFSSREGRWERTRAVWRAQLLFLQPWGCSQVVSHSVTQSEILLFTIFYTSSLYNLILKSS